jgi:hypothetical protein
VFPALIAEPRVQRERCRDQRDTRGGDEKPRPELTAEQKAAEELVWRAREQGLSLTGRTGC